VKARILGAAEGARAYLERLVRGESSAVLREQELLAKISRLEGQMIHLGQRILDDRAMPTGNQLARFTYNQRLELTKSVRERGCNSETHTADRR